MLHRARAVWRSYPGQFWLMFAGMLISTIGASMIWPFLMIYVTQRLELPLTASASLMTLNAGAGLLFSFLTGPIVDRIGRKWVMVISLLGNGLCYAFMSRADSLLAFAVLMAFQGAFNPLYRIGSDAMMADLIPSGRRPEAYSLLRMSNNVGVALGPTIGGFLASTSYNLAFIGATAGLSIYGLLIALFARETLDRRQSQPAGQPARERFGGYDRVLRDRPFVQFVSTFTLTTVCAALVWVLMSVYAKENYGLPENQYGLIAATNAIMVVIFQYLVTQWTRRRRPLAMLAFGTAFYAAANLMISFATGFWGFWVAMVVMTVGELILVPTATTYAADVAPADMRGRYMSLYGLTWNVSTGIGPVFGGLLSDTLGPTFIWYGGALVGLAGVLLFIRLARRSGMQHVLAA